MPPPRNLRFRKSSIFMRRVQCWNVVSCTYYIVRFDESDTISQPWNLLESQDPSCVRGALRRCGAET